MVLTASHLHTVNTPLADLLEAWPAPAGWILAGFLIWSIGCAWVADRLADRFLPAGIGRLSCKAALVVLLMPLPVLDDLLAWPGFAAACSRIASPAGEGNAAPSAPAGRLGRWLQATGPLTFSERCPPR